MNSPLKVENTTLTFGVKFGTFVIKGLLKVIDNIRLEGIIRIFSQIVWKNEDKHFISFLFFSYCDFFFFSISFGFIFLGISSLELWSGLKGF